MADSTGPETAHQPAHLTALGSTEVTVSLSSGEAVSVLGAGKPLALLTYLALAAERTARRDLLVELLWADVAPERGRRTLRQTLWQLRQKLGDHAFETRGDRVTLTLDLTVDRDEFVAAVREGRDDHALRLYRGKFFPTFAAPGGSEFEQWADLERARLHAAYERVVERHVARQLARSNFGDAERAARALRDMDRGRERAWRLLLEVLAASGNRQAVHLEADGLEASLAADGREPEPATRVLLDRLREPREEDRLSASSRLTAELVGRQAEFATVLEAWQDARRGTARHVHVSAPAGLGKTRLLRDLASRIRASGGVTAELRANLGERGIPYMFASDLAKTLAALPGATAISPAAAGTLLDLDPSLASRFPGVTARRPVEGTRRHRAAAVSELVDVGSEEAPLALFIDDVHWIDKASRQLTSAIIGRLGSHRVLVVTAARPPADGDIGSGRTTHLSLPPLTERNIEELITSLAELPAASWATELPRTLTAVTSGSPLFVLETLQLAQDRGLLQIDEGVWHCADPKALSSELSRGHALRRRLQELERRSFEHLLVLAVAGTPLDARTLAGALGRPAEGVETELAALERRGFVVRIGRGWEPAHHNIIEAVAEMASPDAMPGVHGSLGRALAAVEGGDAGTLARAARHLAVGGAEVDLARVFNRWLEDTVGRRDRTRLTERAESLLGELATPRRVRRLVASVPWRRRLRASGRLWPVATAAAAVLLGILVPLAPRLLGNAAPARLTLIGAPIAVVPGTWQLLPAPTLDVRDGSGVVDSTAEVTVTAELAAGNGVLSGTVSLPVRHGRATFDDLQLEGRGTFVLRFTAPGLDPVLSRAFVLVNEDEGSSLRLVGGVLNGQRISPQRRRVVVGPGELIEGDMDLVYTSRWGAASVMLGWTVTWGDPAANVVTIGPLTTPALEMPRRVAVRGVAPDQPGSYRLIFAFFAETSVEEIMSGTNWTVGRPVWGDGNDVARWSAEQLAQADSIGRVRTRMLRGGQWALVWVQATTVEVVVELLTPS